MTFIVIGYGPKLKGSVVKSLKRAGKLVTRDLDELLDMIKPYRRYYENYKKD